MTTLQRIYLVRHGETEGESSIRYHGANDVALSLLGRDQMRGVRRAMPMDRFDVVVASPLSRAWQGAQIVAPGYPVRLEHGFREIDFGRWEGLTREEIAERDPTLYREWTSRQPGFEFPDGECRETFRRRVLDGLDRVLSLPGRTALVVVHKGVVRTIAERLTGVAMPANEPDLGGLVPVRRGRGGGWVASR